MDFLLQGQLNSHQEEVRVAEHALIEAKRHAENIRREMEKNKQEYERSREKVQELEQKIQKGMREVERYKREIDLADRRQRNKAPTDL